MLSIPPSPFPMEKLRFSKTSTLVTSPWFLQLRQYFRTMVSDGYGVFKLSRK